MKLVCVSKKLPGLFRWADRKNKEPNAVTLAAMREANDIAAGRIKTKQYSTKELFDELDREDSEILP